MRQATDVLVVGAGPVGLLLAGELQRRGVDHVLIEQKPAPTYFCKALGVSPRTLEVFDQIGVLREALDRGFRLRGQVTCLNGQDVSVNEFAAADAAYFPFILAQYDTERILREHLHRHGGRVDAGVGLRSFEVTGDQVAARVAAETGAERTVTCRYLVGCDGAHSAVRRGLGIQYDGDAYGMTFMLGDVLIQWHLPRGYAYRMTHTEDGAMRNVVVAIPIPGDPRRYRVSMAAPFDYWTDDADLTHVPTLEEVQATSAPALPPGTQLSGLRWASLYRISHRIVPRYGTERVFLVGDAAHIHPPIGGQGMNTGLQDAHNLAWKLALTLAGRAVSGLLGSYDAERRPVGLEVVTRTSQRMDQVVARGTADESTEELRVDSQLLVSYRGGALLAEDVEPPALAAGPAPGDRAPDASGLRRPLSVQPDRLHALLRGPGHTLLLYADATSAPDDFSRLAELADLVAERFPQQVATYGIVAPQTEPLDLERLPLLADGEGAFRAAYGVAGTCLYLVRPDGYVAYRASPVRWAALDAYLGRILVPGAP